MSRFSETTRNINGAIHRRQSLVSSVCELFNEDMISFVGELHIGQTFGGKY